MKKEIKKTLIISMLGIFLTLSIIVFALANEHSTNAQSGKSFTPKIALKQIKEVPSASETLLTSTKEKKESTNLNAKKKETFSKEALATKKDTISPKITAPEITIYQNTAFSLYDYASAEDDRDGDISGKLVALNTLDSSTLGTQTLDLSVTDSSGNSSTAQQIIHVVEPETVPTIEANKEQQPKAQAIETPETAAAASTPSYQPMTMTLAGQTIAYQNGGQGSGQSIIDSNPSGVVSTWGGSAVQSGSDGMNTHFIGHNPGIFASVFALGAGSQVVVTDGNGTPSTYTVQTILNVDDQGVGINDGQNYWDLIVGTGGGERITLQTCINDSVNVIVIAYK